MQRGYFKQLEGVSAIVAGGASGLGGATAAGLAAAGAKVTIFYLNAELGAAQATAIGGHFQRVDVTDADALGAALAEAGNGKARIHDADVIGKLREVEIVLAQEATTSEACRRIAVSEQTLLPLAQGIWWPEDGPGGVRA